MIRGTTPEYILTVNADLTGKSVYVTFKRLNTVITLTGSRLTVTSDGTNSVIAFRLTQKQTLSLGVGQGEVQVRFIGSDNIAHATEIKVVNVNRVLFEEEIAYE